ncbi:hypothetical protein GCK72_012698 [Caenorhabditis remanei]|uniref:ELM2 domain-containing protein n=1 Tax=Caenorhabditis remanei TaxID=31234 RepID=A0A6A5GNY2_CAERE|nr:hypothetical protein GCK72_012698 [Caenorhabditis remanei]KAF1756245.1 hypothetical protein GCK72_012698 [Caenorhabditis remanei]
MSPSKTTLSKVPTTKSFEPPMNVPGTSSNRSYMNSVSASPISGTSNSSPNYPLFENTPERAVGAEQQKNQTSSSTQTEELNSSERALRAQTCPVDIPGPSLQSNDASPKQAAPSQPVRVDSPAVNKPCSSQTGQKFAVPANPANNGLMDPKADESQQGQAGPAVAPSRPAFKRPYPAQGAANSPKMGKWTRAGQLQMMSQAGQTGQTQMMTPSTSTQNNSLRTAPAGTSQMTQVTSSTLVKTTSQTGPIKQSPTTPARLPGFVSMSSPTPALKSNDRSQSGEVGPAQAGVSGQTASSQSTSADLLPAPETGSSEAEQKRATQIVHPQPQKTQVEESQSAQSSSEAVMPPPRAALKRSCRSKQTAAQQNGDASTSELMGPPSAPPRRSSRKRKNQNERPDEDKEPRITTPMREIKANKKKPNQSKRIPKALPRKKPKVGSKQQVNIPEETSDSESPDREETTWILPDDEETLIATSTLRNEYWCVIWRQFEGLIPYEAALQHFMESNYSTCKAFENIEELLRKWGYSPRKHLREAHMEHYNQLLDEQSFNKVYDEESIPQEYSLVEVKEFYALFHSRQIAPQRLHRNLCVCKEFFCRKLTFEPRWACANCTGQLRQMASPRLCLICQAYKEKTGRSRPISDSYWSGEEVRKILAWKSLEEKLQKEVPREDFEKFLKEKERKRIEEERFSEEEKRLVQSLPKGSEKTMELWMKEIDNPFLKNCHPSTTKIDTIVKNRKDDVMNEKAEPRPKRSCIQSSSQGSSRTKDNGEAAT